MSADEERGTEAEALAPGAVLAAAREAEKLSLAEAARHLKLSVAQVEALEAGEFERLPGPVFVRGFVRNYARLLKLDADALLRSVEPELAPQSLSPEAPPSKDIPFPPRAPSRWPVFAFVALLVVGILAVHEFYWAEPSAPPPRLTAPTPAPPVPPAEPVAAAPAPLPVSIDPVDPAPPPKVTAAGLKEPVQPAAAPTPPTPPAPPAAPAAAVSAPVAEAPAGTGAGLLQLSFADESWVEVRDRSGKLIFAQLNAAGTEKRVRGDPPLSLVIGNASGVRLTYNERPIDLKMHTKVDVARFVLE